jgi:hypothetical protein
MKRVEISEHREEEEWSGVFAANRDALLAVANILLPCGSCSNLIVKRAERHVAMLDIPKDFKYGFALRTVVKFAFQHIRECEEPADHSGAVHWKEGDRNPIRELPVTERFVYYLTDVLRYADRDVSLLTGLGDPERKEMLLFARRRLTYLSAAITT